VFSTVLFGSETWTYKKADKDRILAFEMYCYRRILRITGMQKVSGEEVRRRYRCQREFSAGDNKRKLGSVWSCL
jgi:hypothetical protein